MFILIMGVMETGEKERKEKKSSDSHRYRETKSELSRSLSEGFATFNAGLKKINDELQLKNQANELLSDFYEKNRTAVSHFKFLVIFVEMTEKYYQNSNVTSVKDFIEEREKLLSIILDRPTPFSSHSMSINIESERAKDNNTNFISPIKDRNPEHYDKPALAPYNKNNEQLKTIQIEKTMEIIDERKSDLHSLHINVSFGKSKVLFDGLLDYLGEKELFYRLLDE